MWVKGASGPNEGRFIACTVEPARNVNRCRAFHPDGKLDCERDFRLQPGDRAARREELHYQSWAEGVGIYLDAGFGERLLLKPLMPCDVDD